MDRLGECAPVNRAGTDDGDCRKGSSVDSESKREPFVPRNAGDATTSTNRPSAGCRSRRGGGPAIGFGIESRSRPLLPAHPHETSRDFDRRRVWPSVPLSSPDKRLDPPSRFRLWLHQYYFVDAIVARVYCAPRDESRNRNETDVSHLHVLLRDALNGAPAAGGMRVGSTQNDQETPNTHSGGPPGWVF